MVSGAGRGNPSSPVCAHSAPTPPPQVSAELGAHRSCGHAPRSPAPFSPGRGARSGPTAARRRGERPPPREGSLGQGARPTHPGPGDPAPASPCAPGSALTTCSVSTVPKRRGPARSARTAPGPRIRHPGCSRRSTGHGPRSPVRPPPLPFPRRGPCQVSTPVKWAELRGCVTTPMCGEPTVSWTAER